jgi:sporulation protein YlmC with PRC-barrel domain
MNILITVNGLFYQMYTKRRKIFMKVTDVLGKKVIDKNAFEIGKISDLDLDTEKWAIAGIYISSGILGSDVRISIEDVEKVGDYVTLKIEKTAQ